MGAVLCTDETAKGFAPGSHATTFGGGAVVSAVAAKVLDIMLEQKLADRALDLGEFARRAVVELMEKHPGRIVGSRGLGLLFGIELAGNGQEIWKGLLARKVVCNLTQGTILRLVPPLTIGEDDITAFMDALDDVLGSLEG
jgi:acetylornithine aminotransferase